jgi:hypothetical protein
MPSVAGGCPFLFAGAGIAAEEEKLARSNYQFKKRQKELARKKKKEEKRLKRMEKKSVDGEETADQDLNDKEDSQI